MYPIYLFLVGVGGSALRGVAAVAVGGELLWPLVLIGIGVLLLPVVAVAIICATGKFYGTLLAGGLGWGLFKIWTLHIESDLKVLDTILLFFAFALVIGTIAEAASSTPVAEKPAEPQERPIPAPKPAPPVVRPRATASRPRAQYATNAVVSKEKLERILAKRARRHERRERV
jgi:hypothetical protein